MTHTSHENDARGELLARADVQRRLMLNMARARIACEGAATVMLLCVAMALADLMWPAAPWARALMVAPVIGVAMWTLWRVIRLARSERMSAAEAVGRAERRMLGEEGPARAAVEIAGAHGASADIQSKVTQAMADRVIAHGLQRLRSFDPAAAVDGRPAFVAFRRAAVIAAMILLSALAFAKTAHTQALRLFDPLGDHPPPTSLHFDTIIHPRDLRVGDDVNVISIVTGAFPGDATLAVRDESGLRRIRFPQSSGDGARTMLHQTLVNVQSPLSLRIETDKGRTRWERLSPAPKPRVRSAGVRMTPPRYTGKSESVQTLPAEDVLFIHVGAVVEIELESSLEIARAEAPGAENLTVSGRRATARWRLREDGVRKLSLNVFSTAGFGLDEPVSCGVRTLPDAPPTIEMDQPVRVGPDDEVAPIAAFLNAAVPVTARVSDDVEVASVRCEVAIADGGPDMQWRELSGGITPTRNGFQITATLTPAMLGAAVGETILLRFVAADNRPDEFGGPQSATLGPIPIHIVDEEWLQRRAAEGDGRRGAPAPGVSDQSAAAGEAGSPADESAAESEPAPDGESPGSEGGEPSRGEGAGAGDAGRAAQGDSDNTLTDAGAPVNGLQVFRDREPATDAGDGGRTGDHAGGSLQALSWMSQDGDVLPRIRPDVLNRLSERRREIVARYYELLARPKDTP